MYEEIPLMSPNFYESDEELDLIARQRRNRGRWSNCCSRLAASANGCCRRLTRVCCRQKVLLARNVPVGSKDETSRKFPPNVVRNQKYSVFSFLPLVLFQQFKFFLNFYFLLMALSQFIPGIRIGYLSTYWVPLGFVLSITLIREAYDDFSRFWRDKEVNSQSYERLTVGGSEMIPSSKIAVGDLIIVKKDQRVPADMVLLRTTEKTGSCFIRTDQLDGETDWKLKVAVATTQHLTDDHDLYTMSATVYAEPPNKDIHAFVGTFRKRTGDTWAEESLNIENALWANTVVASGSAMGLVVYTGSESRAAMNTSQPESKVGLVDMEFNDLTKLLFVVLVGLSLIMIILKGFSGPWYRHFFRFILLFSYIIPLSLRVSLDMAKIVYAWLISKDKKIAGSVVRSSTISEELGRLSFLLSDKTGTLTKNVMVFKKIHLGTVAFSTESFDDVKIHLKSACKRESPDASAVAKHSLVFKLSQAVEAIALCHNVTPMWEDVKSNETEPMTEADQQQVATVSYQASSPDEVALVKWCEEVGVTLVGRDLQSIQIRLPDLTIKRYQILQLFPFTSESKRMGVILRDETSGQITLFLKGADTVMSNCVQYNDWLMEECSNLAREGLRTLVVAKKDLSEQQYADFEQQYHQAKISVVDRSNRIKAVLDRLQQELQLLCLTGVEDALQDDVKTTLELLKNAGIKVWMLTGDKQETAVCIAKSSQLVSRTQNLHVFKTVCNRSEAHTELNNLRRKSDVALVIDGDSLKICLEHYEEEFAYLACEATSVVCCRCSPEQKAQIVLMLRQFLPTKRIAAVGDGGNDVSMIQAAHAGIGIVGKEGRQASLAADFSILQFSFLTRLLLVHGRYSYKRSCSMGQFVMHRGLIISTMQAIFSCVFYFASVSLYPGPLMVAFSTVFTMFPIFSLVMDKDCSEKVILTFPELYKEMTKGRSLTYKTFFVWFLASVYQGAVIMYGALLLFDQDFVHIVTISFTSLIITELVMVVLTVHIVHWTMIVAEFFSIAIYAIALFLLPSFFDTVYVRTSGDFWWKTAVITLVSCVPLYIFKYLQKRISPPSYVKLS